MLFRAHSFEVWQCLGLGLGFRFRVRQVRGSGRRLTRLRDSGSSGVRNCGWTVTALGVGIVFDDRLHNGALHARESSHKRQNRKTIVFKLKGMTLRNDVV